MNQNKWETMHSYKFEGRIFFNIDLDADNFNSFNNAVNYIKNNTNSKIIDYYPGGWNTSYMIFIYENIEFKLVYMDFGGTELSVNDDASDETLLIVQKLANKIYDAVNNEKV